jgi:hypothetical protein
MDKELRISIHKIKRLRDSVKRSLDDRGTARALGSLQRASAPGKKMQKIGFIFLLAPEPLTTAAGIPMIIAGKYLDKVYNGSTIADIGHETKNFAHHLTDIKHSMH